jgi:hypothetical protein
MNKSDRVVKGLGGVSICVKELDVMQKFYLETGHDAMITMPDELAQTLNSAIGENR